MKLSEAGEELLLQKITPLLPVNLKVVSGVGDDCALAEFSSKSDLLVLKTDCVVEGVHFTAKAKPREIGWKAMARPLSDFAAVSGQPEFALVTLILPARTELKWVEEIYRGLASAAQMFAVAIVGGETSRTSGPAIISVALTGRVEKNRWRTRAGGRAGDELFVTGRLGGSWKKKHLNFIPRLVESRWLTSRFTIHAMMDLSDGLGADLPRLARASKCGFVLDDAAIPRARGRTLKQAISDGEDYELLFAVSPNGSKNLQTAWREKFPDLPLSLIGKLSEKTQAKLPPGYDHFA